MGIGAIFFIIIIVYRLCQSSGDGTQGGVKSDISANTSVPPLACLMLLILWLSVITSWFVVANNASQFLYPYLYGSLLLVCPSLTSKLPARLGWVKTSYYMGSWSYAFYRRSPFSGAMLRGLQATLRLKNAEQQRKALYWLQLKFQTHKGRLFSGEIVIATIIDSHLTHPNNAEHMAKQLKTLQGLGPASIPSGVSAYAFKNAIAPALANNDWQELADIADQWDTPSTNRLAKFVKEFCGAYIFKRHPFSKITSQFNRLFTLGTPVIYSLPRRYEAAGDYDIQRANIRYDVSTLNKTQSLNEKQHAQFTASLLGEHAQEKWLARAKTLGAWQNEQAWDKIKQSVELCLAQKSNTQHSGDESYYQEVDRQCQNLKYIGYAIARRVDDKQLGNGAQNYLDWVKIHNILNALKNDQSAQLSAFQSVENIIWNWIADLWNTQRERCLVHYICTVCAPFAYQTGNTELHKLLVGITNGEYR